jgi:hypothetical protein
MENAVATVKGGLYETVGLTTLTQISGVGQQRRRVAQLLGDKSLLDLRQRLIALVGAAAGGAALKTIGRVEANVELGGKRTIETETLINRNTTAGDVTLINNDLLALTSKTTFGASPPANLDGNPLGTR